MNLGGVILDGYRMAAVLLMLLLVPALGSANAPTPDGARKPATKRGFSVSDTDAFPPPVKDDELPEIEARRFPVKAIKMVTSTRSYLFDDGEGAQPRVGKIILLKDDSGPIMAFRVLRTFALSKQFIARRVRRYGAHETLPLNVDLVAIERIGETGLPPQSDFSAEEESDSQELMEAMDGASPSADFFEGDVNQEASLPADTAIPPSPPGDANLDGDLSELDEAEELEKLEASSNEILPTPLAEDPELDGEEEISPSRAHPDDDEEPIIDPGAMLMEDVEPMDIYRHGVAVQFGFLSNRGPEGASTFFSAAGLRYSYTLGKLLFARTNQFQDSITLEGGLFHYKIQGYLADDDNGVDAYSVTPLLATLRYTLHLTESTGLFVYGGMEQNLAKSTGPAFESNADGEALLSGFRPALGAGLIMRLGPGWEARADLGIDMIALGMMLRF